jgi:uncharacterized protein
LSSESSGHFVPDAREVVDGGPSDAASGRVGRDDLRPRLLDREELAGEGVVLGVADLGPGQDVVEVLVAAELVAQRGGAKGRRGGVLGKNHGPIVGAARRGDGGYSRRRRGSPAARDGMKRKLFFAGGVVAVGLGVAGIALPLLPTTPFLLLAAYLFARSSPAHYDRLLAHRVLGPYVRDWAEKRGLRRSAKVRALLLLWVVLLPTSSGWGTRARRGSSSSPSAPPCRSTS